MGLGDIVDVFLKRCKKNLEGGGVENTPCGLGLNTCNTVSFPLKLRPIKQVSGTDFIHSCFYFSGTFAVILHVIAENIRLSCLMRQEYCTHRHPLLYTTHILGCTH